MSRAEPTVIKSLGKKNILYGEAGGYHNVALDEDGVVYS